MNDYIKQANDFLTKTGTKIEVNFISHDKYFHDDDSARDIYEIKITRKDIKPFIFRFGQSLVNSGVPNFTGVKTIYQKEKAKENALLSRKPPSSYDILAILTKNDVGSFNDFCADFGYSNDSITAQKIYINVQNEYSEVNKLFNDVLDELKEIQ